MAVFGLQLAIAALAAVILVGPSLQSSYSGPTCDKEFEINHVGNQIKGSPSGTVFKIPLDQQPVTSTTTAKPGEKPHCQVPYQGNPDLYDWLQVLQETGGQPGKVNATKQKAETPSSYENPCSRPIRGEEDGEKVYTYKQSDLKTNYRSEDAYLRFAGTKYEFIDIRGTVVWTPPKSVHDPRIYVATYNVDDTGLWFNVKKQNCTFTTDPVGLFCKGLTVCKCVNDELFCKDVRGVSPNLLASLVG